MDPKKLIGKGIIVEPSREKRHVLGEKSITDIDFDLPVGSMCGKLILVNTESVLMCEECYGNPDFSDMPKLDAMNLCFATECDYRARQDRSNVIWVFNDGKKFAE